MRPVPPRAANSTRVRRKADAMKYKCPKHKNNLHIMKNYTKLFSLLVILLFALSCSSHRQLSTSLHTLPTADAAVYTDVQRTTFQYFWDGAEPTSGLARERINMNDVYPENDKNVVTTGGSGFGLMAILAGIERGFITRQQGYERFDRIVHFLERADRFHGAWPHWINGETGKVKPFGKKDNGGDLVETSFLLQGLLAVRQYFATRQ